MTARLQAPRLRRFAARALFAVLAGVGLWLACAQAAEDSCRLTPQQSAAAVKAFRQLYPMQSDPQVILGFRGQRGMKEPTNAEPPAMPFDAMVRHANDWIAAMDAEFHPPPECGCEVDGIALEIRHHLYTDPESPSARAGYAQFDGVVVFDVLLQKEEGEGDLIYRNERTVLRPLVVRHVTPSFLKCTGSGKREEHWMVTARIDEEQRSMQLHFSFTEDAEEAEWTCTGPGFSETDTLNVDVQGMLKTLNMPAESGAVGEASKRGVKAIEAITITVIDSPVGQ